MYVHASNVHFDRSRRRRLGRALVGMIVTLLAAATVAACGSSASTTSATSTSVSSVSGIAQSGPGLTQPTTPKGTRGRAERLLRRGAGFGPELHLPGCPAAVLLDRQRDELQHVDVSPALLVRQQLHADGRLQLLGRRPADLVQRRQDRDDPPQGLEVVGRRAGDLARRRLLHQPLQGEPSRELRVRPGSLPGQPGERRNAERVDARPASEPLL